MIIGVATYKEVMDLLMNLSVTIVHAWMIFYLEKLYLKTKIKCNGLCLKIEK